MKALIIIVALLVLSGCTVTAEIGAGWNGNLYDATSWDNRGAVGANLALRGSRQYTKRVQGHCEYRHLSQYDAGRPFESFDEYESSVDHVGCGISVRLFGDE